MNAADFGVPQKRQRSIILGIRNNIPLKYDFPEPLHSEQESFFTPPYVPLKEVIFDESQIEDKYYFSERAVQGMLNAKKI
ncbi:DNA cytosine methyltransferase [Psychrobacillus sp. MER TA 171]|uniref:DNA cytosine methyltransferase n=1 Tax=Psychrobacillus sp. MER TA 171 TaxID=2939577 RepID=UPI00204226E1|nr:DNA cytosine methyltransferase [Psychrobacillus sp. MER TA 171]